MTTSHSKRRRLQTILIVAAAIGSSSTVLSGTLAAIAIQEPTTAQSGAVA